MRTLAYRLGVSNVGVATNHQGAVELRWPDFTWEHSFEHFRPGARVVRLVEPTAA